MRSRAFNGIQGRPTIFKQTACLLRGRGDGGLLDEAPAQHSSAIHSPFPCTGTLKMAPKRLPEATASCSTSRVHQERIINTAEK